MGLTVGCADSDYEAAGAGVSADRNQLLSSSDLVLRLRKPPLAELQVLKKGSIQISFLDPFHETDLVNRLAEAGISSISMEMIPRTTKAQKMDALSSQASLAGYVAVILAAERLDRVFPMMTTPAGTIAPVRVFVIGAGVAGLQAIATAKRLGARGGGLRHAPRGRGTGPVAGRQVRPDRPGRNRTDQGWVCQGFD